MFVAKIMPKLLINSYKKYLHSILAVRVVLKAGTEWNGTEPIGARA